MPVPNKWTMDDALELVRGLQKDTRRYGYHLTLGGGVLNNGESQKDLDLFFLPLQNPKFPMNNPDNLVSWLTKMWGPYETIGENYEDTNIPSLPVAPQTAYEQLVAASATLDTGSLGFQSTPTRSSGAGRRLYNPPQTAPSDVEYYQEVSQILPMPTVTGVYKYRLKFNRRGDRIDVFIL